MGYILLSGLFIIENIKISALRSLVSSTQIYALNHHSLLSAIAWMNVWNVRKGSWLDPMLQLKLPLTGPLQSIKHWELILKFLPYHSLLLGSSSTFPRFFSRIKYFSICFLKEVLNESPRQSLKSSTIGSTIYHRWGVSWDYIPQIWCVPEEATVFFIFLNELKIPEGYKSQH